MWRFLGIEESVRVNSQGNTFSPWVINMSLYGNTKLNTSTLPVCTNKPMRDKSLDKK